MEEGSVVAVVTGDEFAHLSRVLRLKAGAEVAVFNGRGLELSGVIEAMDARGARVSIKGRIEGVVESPAIVTLVQGLTKGSKPEFVVQKATELGVAGIIFFTAGRTVPRPLAAGAKRRIARWRRVAIEAAKQCGRSVLPAIDLATGLDPAIAGVADDLKIVLCTGPPCGDATVSGIKSVLEAGCAGTKNVPKVTVIVGPEGGLSTEEFQSAMGAGFTPASLGPRTMRAETAALTVVSIIQYVLGDMG